MTDLESRPSQEDLSDQSDDRKILPVSGSEYLLLGRNSALKQIPVNIEPKQAFFLDGIRHAIEIMDVAYGRLRESLTDMALNPPASNDLPDISAHVFLDAWSFVDALVRFQTLYKKMPGMKFDASKARIPSLDVAMREFILMRNVADHLPGRAEFVISQKGAALGELNWLTGAQLMPEVIAWHCTLRPGTLRSIPPLQTDPIISTLDWPTDSIRLSAGGYQGNLSVVRAHIAVRVRHLEAQLQRAFQQPTQMHVGVISDVFSRRPVKRAG